MKKTLILSLILSAVVVVFARNYIMKIELTDGTTRYIDTEQVDQFNLIKLSEIPEQPIDKYITVDLWTDAVWLHSGFFTHTARNVRVTDRYVPNDPDIHELCVYGWCPSAKPIKMLCRGEEAVRTLEVPCQPTGYTDAEHGEIWIADRQHYYSDVLRQSAPDSIASVIYNPDVMTLEVVYYGVGEPGGGHYAVQTTERVYSPSNYSLGRISADLPTKDNGHFRWPITFADIKQAASQIVYRMYPYNDFYNDIYTADWYNDIYGQLNESSPRADFANNRAQVQLEADSAYSNVFIIYGIYDKDGVLIKNSYSDINLPLHLVDITRPTNMGYGIYESVAFGDSFFGELTFFPADRDNTEPRMELNYLSLMDNQCLQIHFPNGLEPDSTGCIAVSVPVQATIGNGPSGRLSIVSVDEFYKLNGVDYTGQMSFYSPSEGTISFYVAYYNPSDPTRVYGPYWETFTLNTFAQQGANIKPKKIAADRNTADTEEAHQNTTLTIEGEPHPLF